MIRDPSSKLAITIFAAIFVATFSVEMIILNIFGAIFDTNSTLRGPISLLPFFSIGLTAWIFALAGYFLLCVPVTFVDQSSSDIAKFSAPKRPSLTQSTYVPGEAAYKNIFFTLIALSSANGNVDAEKIEWVEALHAHWIKLVSARRYPELSGKKISKTALVKLASELAANGPFRIIDMLQKYKTEMNARDKDVFVKLCFLLATSNGPISAKETDLIIKFTTTIDFPQSRMFAL